MVGDEELCRTGGRVMNIGETIAYAIRKECSRYSLVNWCKEWGFTIEQFKRFLDGGIDRFRTEQEEE